MRSVFYYQAVPAAATAAVDVQALGICERMKPGAIRHGGSGFPFLFMYFHTPAFLSPDLPDGTDMCNQAIIWGPGAQHHYGNLRRHWTHSWLIIAGADVAEAVKAHALPLGQPVSLHRGGEIFSKYLGLLHDELMEQRQPDVLLQGGIIHLWCRAMARALRGDQADFAPQNLLDVRAYLQGNFMKPVTLEALAARAHLSVSQFSFQFRRYFGLAPVHFLLHLRMKHAALLLQDHSLAVGQVAEMVGFTDPLFFSRQFRRYAGACPRVYRRTALAGSDCAKQT